MEEISIWTEDRGNICMFFLKKAPFSNLQENKVRLSDICPTSTFCGCFSTALLCKCISNMASFIDFIKTPNFSQLRLPQLETRPPEANIPKCQPWNGSFRQTWSVWIFGHKNAVSKHFTSCDTNYEFSWMTETNTVPMDWTGCHYKSETIEAKNSRYKGFSLMERAILDFVMLDYNAAVD